ncbi:hypothetical protein E4H12_11570 [Candidatus Thorarchaeota archaeon]|nr:hypothetical protein [Candidatus Thorarchaeota archaeon]TFG96215.1 MAG: hypothetical protein E4H12_11570 [Candidatus Thorarchaeota archaeon]
MPDWKDLHERARRDVDAGLKAWTTVLKEDIGSRIVYAYAKGSALKKWESPIDYVPTISDLDIHIMLTSDDSILSGSSESFEEAMHLSKRYEDEYLLQHPEHLHIPRSQIMTINRLTTVVEYVPPRPQDIRALLGDMPKHSFQEDDEIRRIDRQNLMNYQEYIEVLPRRLFDRTGLDYWFIIREMCWRVSPAPVRLLTQITEDPLEVWSWNRTTIAQTLRSHDYNEIADHYTDFYVQGWDLFLSAFTNSEAYRNCIAAGYYSLVKCREEVQKIN